MSPVYSQDHSTKPETTMNESTITPTEHEKNEWSRCATAMYANDCNPAGHLLSMSAAYPKGAPMAVSRFDKVASIYRAWLCFNEFPKEAA